jgi:hypothetical protein
VESSYPAADFCSFCWRDDRVDDASVKSVHYIHREDCSPPEEGAEYTIEPIDEVAPTKGVPFLFEFHGWAVLSSDEGIATVRPGHSSLVDNVNARLGELRDKDRLSQFQIHDVGNEILVLTVHGLRNHPQTQVIALFQWIAEQAPKSYGLLYVLDDEDGDHDNEFGVWRLARGQLSEQADPFLSPRIPIIEDRYGGNADAL